MTITRVPSDPDRPVPMKTISTLVPTALACAALLQPAALAEEPPVPADPPPPAAPEGDGPQGPGVGEPPPPAAPAPDQRPPRLVLRGRRTQRLAPMLRAYGTCDERCEFEARARVHGVPELRSMRVITPSKASEGGTRMLFELRVSPRAEKLFRRALAAGREARVTLEVTAYDLADNATDRSLSIRVEPPPPDAPPFRRS